MPKSLFITTIKKQSVFIQLNKCGTKFQTPYFILILKKNFNTPDILEESFIIYGLKVTKKTGNAVIRNKIKRRIKHLVRIFSKQLRPNKYGIVIIPRVGFDKVVFSVLNSEFQKTLKSELKPI